MEPVKLSAAVKMVFASFVLMEEEFATEDHKKLLWDFANKDVYTPNDFFAVLDYLYDNPVAGPNVKDDPDGKAGWINIKLESIVQLVAMDFKLDFLETVRLYRDLEPQRKELLKKFFTNAPALPDKETILNYVREVNQQVKKEIIAALKEVTKGGNLGSLSGLLGNRPSEIESADTELDAWGEETKRKLQ